MTLRGFELELMKPAGRAREISVGPRNNGGHPRCRRTLTGRGLRRTAETRRRGAGLSRDSATPRLRGSSRICAERGLLPLHAPAPAATAYTRGEEWPLHTGKLARSSLQGPC